MTRPYADYTKADLMRLLESLTPGGSEFHESPETCADHIRARGRTSIKLAVKLKECEKKLKEET